MGDVRSNASSTTRSVGLDADRMRELYRALLLPRLIEEKALLLLRQGRLSKWFSGMGQEAIAVGVAFALEADDWILPMHRNLGVFTTRSVDLGRLFPPALRQGRRIHQGARPHVPLRPAREAHRRDDQPPRGHGAAWRTAWPRPPSSAASGSVAATFSGDGGTSEGTSTRR